MAFIQEQFLSFNTILSITAAQVSNTEIQIKTSYFFFFTTMSYILTKPWLAEGVYGKVWYFYVQNIKATLLQQVILDELLQAYIVNLTRYGGRKRYSLAFLFQIKSIGKE